GAFSRPVDRLLVARVFLIGVDDFDAGAAEGVEQVVEFLRRGDLGRQELIHLVVEEIPLLLADADELPYFVVFFFERERFSLVGFHDVNSSMRWAKVRFWFNSRSSSPPCDAEPSPCSRSISRCIAARSRSQRSRFKIRAHSARSPGPVTGAVASP